MSRLLDAASGPNEAGLPAESYVQHPPLASELVIGAGATHAEVVACSQVKQALSALAALMTRRAVPLTGHGGPNA
ncbi:MAG: hypothetical protein MJD61_11550 [Proteobacteria bacterium]|nr:hypothetical protein [Pseudomonadota bacterium]